MTREDTLAIYNNYLKPDVINPLPSEELKAALLPLCCVRLFDSSMIAAVLSAASPKIFGRCSPEEAQEQILMPLKSTQLMVWEKGYALPRTIRHLATSYLVDHQPDVYERANTAALSQYQSWLARPVDSRSLFVVEELYHLASLNPKVDLTKQLKQRLSEYPPQWIRSDEEWQRQIEQLVSHLERDSELAQLTAYVPAMLGILKDYK